MFFLSVWDKVQIDDRKNVKKPLPVYPVLLRHENLPVNIAYLVNQYPKTSHSFIRREIIALELLGLKVKRYSLRGTAEELVDEGDRQELKKTLIVIAAPYFRRAFDGAGTMFAHPVRFFRALTLCIRCGLRSDRTVAVHIAYLLEALIVTAWCKRDEIKHLHVHFGTNSCTVGMLVNTLCDIPWSFTAHGPEEFDRPLGIGLAEKISSATFVAAISSFGRSQIWRWTPFSQWDKIHIIRCGLDADFLEAASVQIGSSLRLLCVGRLCEQKGQLLLVKAAGILKRRGMKFELVFAGDGPMRREIENAIITEEVADCVSITGWLSGQRVREEILRARALVLPSFAEGLPVVIMESMALRRPVVSTLVAGIPELVTPGESGWLVAAGDIAALTEALAEVLSSDPDKLDAMGSRGRERVLASHNALNEAAKLKHLFEERSR